MAGLSKRIQTRQASVTDATLGDPRAHLIWSEGAAYNVGMRNALECWRKFLHPGGSLALTEISSLVESPPAEAHAFWSDAYPGTQSQEANLALMCELGFEVLESFSLPDADWLEHYYEPQDSRHRELTAKYANDAEALAALGDHSVELDLYRRHRASYGYVFYLLRDSLGSS